MNGKTAAMVDAADIDKAKAHLLAFFAAMAAWEKFAEANFSEESTDEISEKVKALYRQYATEKHHDQDRYSWSGMDGGTYGKHKIVDVEIVSKSRAYIHTNENIFQDRFLMIRQEDGMWRIDSRQRKREKWEKQAL